MMKNRTKKMMFMTLVATLAVATLMMARGLAAPVAYKSCPDTAALTSALKSAATNSTCPSSQVMIQLLSAPNANLSSMLGNATIQDLLAKYGVKLSTVPCSTVKPTATPAPTKTAAPTATAKPTATPAPTATARPTATPAPTKTVAPTATAKPTATPAPSGSMTADEQKMINLVNADRAANGLPALTFDASLRAGALSHSVDMSQNNYFSHTSPTYGDFTTRVKAAGIKYSAAGENIAMYGSVETAETAFMNSPGHRANILNTSYTRIGIGIVHNSNGYYYITQWFAK